MTPEEVILKRMWAEKDAVIAEHEKLRQQLREAEAKAAACVLAMKPLLGDAERVAHDREAPADMREDAWAYVSACDADALPTRAKALLAVVEAADAFVKARESFSDFDINTRQADWNKGCDLMESTWTAFIAAVYAWRKGGGK